MMVVRFSPQMSVLWSILSLIVVCSFRKETRLGLKKIFRALEGGARTMLTVSTVLITSGIIVGVLNLTGLGINLSAGLIEVSGGNTFFLLCLAAITCIILGMGMTTAGAYMLLAVLVAPALIKLGLTPIAVHMYVFYWGLAALVTPPVCGGAYVAAGIAGAPPFKTGWQSAALGIVTYIVPFMFIYNPAILMIGSASDIILTFMSTLVGIVALAVAIEGYLFKRINLLERAIFLVVAIVLIIPGWLTDFVGISVLVLVVMWHKGIGRSLLRKVAQ
jgi:TRAP transporter 4TM/12TM fusion protein